jgi:hypothetical protein
MSTSSRGSRHPFNRPALIGTLSWPIDPSSRASRPLSGGAARVICFCGNNVLTDVSLFFLVPMAIAIIARQCRFTFRKFDSITSTSIAFCAAIKFLCLCCLSRSQVRIAVKKTDSIKLFSVHRKRTSQCFIVQPFQFRVTLVHLLRDID